jgi:hypothetical protein
MVTNMNLIWAYFHDITNEISKPCEVVRSKEGPPSLRFYLAEHCIKVRTNSVLLHLSTSVLDIVSCSEPKELTPSISPKFI